MKYIIKDVTGFWYTHFCLVGKKTCFKQNRAVFDNIEDLPPKWQKAKLFHTHLKGNYVYVDGSGNVIAQVIEIEEKAPE